MYVVSRDYEPLSDMVRSFFQKEMSLGSGKRAMDAAQDRRQGRQVAVSECIATQLTLARIKAYPMLDPVPAVDSWEVQKALNTFYEQATTASGKDYSEILSDAYDAVVALAQTEDLEKANTNARRQRIEKGETDLITEEDAKYFAEMAETIKASAQGYERLSKVKYLTKDGVTEIDV